MMNDVILDLIFPPRCAVCDDILLFGKKYICQKCKKKIVYIKEPVCLKCGKELSEDKEYCNDCLTKNHLYIQGKAVFDYGSIAGSLHRFKNKNRPEYSKYYAKMIYLKKKDWIMQINPDAFIPVPIHESKYKIRGYNQSELISKELSKLTKIPTIKNFIIRTKKTVPLKNLNLSERQKNLKKAFKVARNDVKLKTIVIIDDIYTSGSTIDEISRSVLKVMDCKIYFLSLTIGRGI